MTVQNGKQLIVPLEVELERLTRLVSEKEKMSNPRVVKMLSKLRNRLDSLREMVSPNPMKHAEVCS